MNKTLYLFHGMGGNKSDWDFISSDLSEYHLIPFELSEFSSIPSLEEIAKKIAARIANSPPIKFSLCGYSLGGRLAILLTKELLALQCEPEKLILISAGLGFENEEQRILRLKVDQEWADLAKAKPELFWEKWYKQDLFSQFSSLPQEKKEKWLKSRKSIDYKYLAHQLSNLSPARHPNLRPTLSQVLNSGISVLYIAGEVDKKYLNQAQELNDDYRISVATIANTSHLVPLEAPAELAKLIDKFLKDK